MATRPRDPERTRVRLLDAGLSALRDEPADRLFEKLEARPIAARAGLSIGAFYHHFDGPSAFVAALLEYSLAKQENPAFGAARTAFTGELERGETFPTAVMAGARAALRSQDSNPTFALQMAVWSKIHQDRTMADRMRRTWMLVQSESTTFYLELLAVLEIEPRPPYTIEDLSAAIIALFDGFTLRRGASMGDEVELFGVALLGVIAILTRPLGDTADAPTYAAHLLPAGPSAT